VKGDYSFYKADINDTELMEKLARDADAIVNFAAESHVDRSISDSSAFLRSNVLGVHSLLEAVRRTGVRFHQISTDEVYGSLPLEGAEKFDERSPYNPRNPYSATKAAADFLVRAYSNTYRLPVTISNCSNNFGPYQHPEKLIPKTVINALSGRRVPVYGDGRQVRDWIYVEDHCSAIDLILRRGEPGETYLVSAGNERHNLDVVREVLSILGKGKDLVQFVPDRPGHDVRYALDASKLMGMGWRPSHTFEEALRLTVAHYVENYERYARKVARTILVLGGSGFLGSYLMKELDAVGTSSSGSFGTVRLDARDEKGLRALIKELKVSAVVNADGMTGVDACEGDPRTAEEINGRAAGMTASVCEELKVPLIHISTDYVFDGEKGKYKEDDPPNPINEYGRAKLMGEREVLARGGVVIRISTPFGPNLSRRKQSFAELVASSLRAGKEVRAAADLFSTPTYTPYAARLIGKLLEARGGGDQIYHLGSVERVSRYEFAVMVARALGLDVGLIRSVSASQLGFVARRPRDTSFDVAKVSKILTIRPLEEDIGELSALLRGTSLSGTS